MSTSHKHGDPLDSSISHLNVIQLMASLLTTSWNNIGYKDATLLSEHHTSSQNLILLPSPKPSPPNLEKNPIQVKLPSKVHNHRNDDPNPSMSFSFLVWVNLEGARCGKCRWYLYSARLKILQAFNVMLSFC